MRECIGQLFVDYHIGLEFPNSLNDIQYKSLYQAGDGSVGLHYAYCTIGMGNLP